MLRLKQALFMQQKIETNESTTQQNKPETTFLFRLTFRAYLFLLLMLIVLTLFYVMGNFQQFLDSTQHFNLLLSSVVSIALIFFSFIGLVESIVYSITTKQKKFIFYAALFLLTLIIVTVVLLLLRTIIFLAAGL